VFDQSQDLKPDPPGSNLDLFYRRPIPRKFPERFILINVFVRPGRG
jgi:hypothetical protein